MSGSDASSMSRSAWPPNWCTKSFGSQVVGQNDAAKIDRILLDKLNRALCGLLARGIAVKQVDDLFRKARQRFYVMLRQRRSQRCHHVAKPSLPTCDALSV